MSGAKAEEAVTMSRAGIRNYSVGESRHRGLSRCLEEAVGSLRHCDAVYLSFDVDAMDCHLVCSDSPSVLSHCSPSF